MAATVSGMVTLANELHSLKTFILMVVTESGMVMLANELQYSKALTPMVVTESGMVMLANTLHPAKAQSPTVVTESGIVTVATVSFNTFHAPHQSFSILAVPSGMLKCIRGNELHPVKAWLPMVVTELGILILSKESHH